MAYFVTTHRLGHVNTQRSKHFFRVLVCVTSFEASDRLAMISVGCNVYKFTTDGRVRCQVNLSPVECVCVSARWSDDLPQWLSRVDAAL